MSLLPFALIFLGLMLLVVEVFIPSGGIFFILSVCGIISGVVLVFFRFGTTEGLITLLALFLIIPVVVGIAFYYWPRTSMGKMMMLAAPEDDTTMADLPDHQELEQLMGQVGKAVTPLRPSGVTVFQGRRVDSKTEGLFVDSGQWVKVIDVHAGQVTVRPLMDDELRQIQDLNI